MREELVYFVYVTASKPYGTLYIGVTNHLHTRVVLHREGTASQFMRKYNGTRLVWFEVQDDIEMAIQREKSIKRCPASAARWVLGTALPGSRPPVCPRMTRRGEVSRECSA